MLTLSTSPFLSPLPLPDLPGINDQSKSSHTSRAAPTISLPSPPLTPETVPTASDDSLAAEDDDSDDDSDDDDDSISEESFSDEYQSDSEDSDDDYSPPASSAFPKKKPLSKYSRPTFKRRASSNAASSTLSRLSSFSPAPGATHLSASPSRSSASAEHLRVQEAVIRTFKQRTLQSPSASASSSPRSLPSSSKQCSEPRTHPCSWPGCDVAFTRQPDLNRHFMIHSSDPEKPKHVCTGVPVDRAGDFGIKDTSAMEVYSFKDEVWIGGCFKGFSRRDALKRHVERNSRACIGEIAPGKMYGAKAKPGPKSRRRSVSITFLFKMCSRLNRHHIAIGAFLSSYFVWTRTALRADSIFVITSIAMLHYVSPSCTLQQQI